MKKNEFPLYARLFDIGAW